MKTILVVFCVIFALAGLEVGNQYFTIRGDLMAERKETHEEWTNVGAALQHRAALISGLAGNLGAGEYSTVASQDIATARKVLDGQGSAQEKLAANERLTTVLAQLLVEAKSQPRLKADRTFLQWQDEMAKCDNQVEVERSRYNKMLEHYNARIQGFPESLVASVAGFRRDDAYFRTTESLTESPRR